MALTEKQIEDALTAHAGFISSAARALGVTYQAIYDRTQRSDNLKKVLNDIRESHIDMAESKLLTNIKSGELGAICFFLKCQAKHRGYVERQELTGANGSKLHDKIEIEFINADKDS